MLPELGRAQEDEVFGQLEGQRTQLLAQPPTKQGEVGPVGAGGGQAGEGPAASEGRQERGGTEEGDALHLPVDKDLKPSISSEDDKPEDDDLLSKFLLASFAGFLLSYNFLSFFFAVGTSTWMSIGFSLMHSLRSVLCESVLYEFICVCRV